MLPRFVRGCSAFGSTNSSGIIEPMCRPERRVSSSTKCASWRMVARSGNPRFMLIGSSDSGQDFFAQRVVLHRAAGFRSEGENRFLVGRAFFETDRFRDDGVEE